MKKLLALLMVAAMLFAAVACSTDSGTTKESTTSDDTSGSEDTTTVVTSDTNSEDTSESSEQTTDKPTPSTVSLRGNVKATVNKNEWVIDENINYKKYSYMGIGNGLETYIANDVRFKAYNVIYKLLDKESGEYKDVAKNKVNALSAIGVYFKDANATAKTVTAYIDEFEVTILPEYSRIDANFGSLVIFRFKTNIPTTFVAAIGEKKGALKPKSGTYIDQIVPTGTPGEYEGRVSLVVPHDNRPITFINFYIDNLAANFPFVASIPLYTTEQEYVPDYELKFIGDWSMIEADRYIYDLHELFYSVYPRLYARWGTGKEPKVITFQADKSYDGIAYAQGTKVVVAVDYANKNPYDIGFFSHEITHSVQQFSFVYGDNVKDGYNAQYGNHNAWWTENHATYGGFRYFHWADGRWVQVYQATDSGLQDWGYHPYGNPKWFFAYMDWKYPSEKDAQGNRVYGLIDSIVFGIKNRELDTDRPKVKETKFNQLVKRITGCETIDALRLQFVAELRAGTFNFKGYADYPCNFMTEGLPGLADPNYPMVGPKTHGNNTAGALPTAIRGTAGNLVIGAKIHSYSGQTKDEERVEMLIDGNEATKWCATEANVVNKFYQLQQVPHFVIIDLGEKKTFNTYTVVLAGVKESDSYNMKEWEICISDDSYEWTSLDYQKNNTKTTVSFNVGEQSARYILIKVFAPTQTTQNTVRLYEFGLYKK